MFISTPVSLLPLKIFSFYLSHLLITYVGFVYCCFRFALVSYYNGYGLNESVIFCLFEPWESWASYSNMYGCWINCMCICLSKIWEENVSKSYCMGHHNFLNFVYHFLFSIFINLKLFNFLHISIFPLYCHVCNKMSRSMWFYWICLLDHLSIPRTSTIQIIQHKVNK